MRFANIRNNEAGFSKIWNIHSMFYLCTVDKREQIILAAMTLLIENGVQGTPMSAIAKEANTGMGTIYNYFPTKEDLINSTYIYIKQDELKSVAVPHVNEPIKKQFEHLLV